jgi:glyoxylase-like metal-dependent hydrolase (beta-lactamase superfamily II)
MEQGLQEIGVDLERTDIFITHLHADHFGLVAKLARKDRTVFFNRPDKEIIESTVGWEPMVTYAGLNGFPRTSCGRPCSTIRATNTPRSGFPICASSREGDIISIGSYELRCVETPGHTLGHICLYDHTHKVLIAGDHLLIDITPNIQCWSDRENPLQRYLESLEKVAKLPVDSCCRSPPPVYVFPGTHHGVEGPTTAAGPTRSSRS